MEMLELSVIVVGLLAIVVGLQAMDIKRLKMFAVHQQMVTTALIMVGIKSNSQLVRQMFSEAGMELPKELFDLLDSQKEK
jgi:hypothetical protein